MTRHTYLNGLQIKIIRPALEAVDLPASRPAQPTTDTEPPQPATKGVGFMTYGTRRRSCG